MEMLDIQYFNYNDALPIKISKWISDEGIKDVTGYIEKDRYKFLKKEFLDMFEDDKEGKKINAALSFILNIRNQNEYYNLYRKSEYIEVTVMKDTTLVVSKRGSFIIVIEGETTWKT